MLLFVTESWWGMDDVQDEEVMAVLMYQVREDGEIVLPKLSNLS
jgi:hypothetical protein